MTAPIVVVAGALANKPGNGGEAWVRLSWVRALAELGCEVHFLEELESDVCVDPAGARGPAEGSVNHAYFEAVVAWAGLTERATLLADGEWALAGLAAADAEDLLATADLLVNISGNLRHPRLLDAARRRAYVDLDPGFTQAWHEEGRLGDSLDRHHLHATVAANIGQSGCPIPTGGFRWQAVQQPAVLDDWALAPPEAVDRFTTVARWRPPHGRIRLAGQDLGLKVHEFRRFAELPRRSPHRFEVVLAIDAGDLGDRTMLTGMGWELRDPAVVAHPDGFRQFIAASSAEWSVAQGTYVDTRSGWCSDRTVRYLASGRPALVQDTGIGRAIPVGDGLVTFQTLEEAVAGADRIASDHEHHAKAARALAEELFAPMAALGPFLDAGLTP